MSDPRGYHGCGRSFEIDERGRVRDDDDGESPVKIPVAYCPRCHQPVDAETLAAAKPAEGEG